MKDEVTKTKTRNAILNEQLKAKDKFIDELLKSTYMMNQAMNTGPPELQGEEKKEGTPSKGGIKNANKTYQELLEKGPYSILKLKKQVADLKEMIQNKT